MEWKIRFDQSAGVMRATQLGLFSIEEQAQFLNDIVSHEDWRPGMPLMFDYTELEVPTIDARQLEQIAAMLAKLKERLGESKLALVSNSDLLFGLGRQFQMMLESHLDNVTCVFRDEKPAIRWLHQTDMEDAPNYLRY